MMKLGHWSVSRQAKIHRYTCFKGSRSAVTKEQSVAGLICYFPEKNSLKILDSHREINKAK